MDNVYVKWRLKGFNIFNRGNVRIYELKIEFKIKDIFTHTNFLKTILLI